LCPFPAGGGTDVNARIVSEHMSRTLGQPIVIENVAGAGGTTGTARAMRADPNGYTIEMGQMGTHASAVAFYPNLEPTFVPFNGAAPAINALIGGQVDYLCDGGAINSAPHVQSGTIKAYSIDAEQHSVILPNVPTAKEWGLPEFKVSAWVALFAPKRVTLRRHRRENLPADFSNESNTDAVEHRQPKSLTPHSSCLDDPCPAGNVPFHKIGERLLAAARFFRDFVGEGQQPLARNIVIKRPIQRVGELVKNRVWRPLPPSPAVVTPNADVRRCPRFMRHIPSRLSGVRGAMHAKARFRTFQDNPMKSMVLQMGFFKILQKADTRKRQQTYRMAASSSLKRPGNCSGPQ
jgi:hypothetical protein